MSESRKQAPEKSVVEEQEPVTPELTSLTPEQQDKVKGGLGSTARGPNAGIQAN